MRLLHFTWWDVLWCSSILIVLYVLFGWPSSWVSWVCVPFGLAIGNVIGNWRRERRQ